MKYAKLVLILFVSTLFLSGCVTLKQPMATFHSSLEGYKYIYIIPTSEKQSVEGEVHGGSYGVYGGTTTTSVNPMELIAGHFIKGDYIRIPEVNPEKAEKTIIVGYGEENDGVPILFVKKASVIIQLISADENEVICVCTGEATGKTEVEAITKAINLAMGEVFNKAKP